MRLRCQARWGRQPLTVEVLLSNLLGNAWKYSVQVANVSINFGVLESPKSAQALARPEAPDTKMGRYKAPDSLLRFLRTL